MPKFIPELRQAWRLYSVWAFAAITTIQGSVLAFLTPAQLAAIVTGLPGWTWGELLQSVVAFLAVTGGIGRLIAQEAPN
jgi:hypothetical protein